MRIDFVNVAVALIKADVLVSKNEIWNGLHHVALASLVLGTVRLQPMLADTARRTLGGHQNLLWHDRHFIILPISHPERFRENNDSRHPTEILINMRGHKTEQHEGPQN